MSTQNRFSEDANYDLEINDSTNNLSQYSLKMSEYSMS